jgi:hypothetical protein
MIRYRYVTDVTPPALFMHVAVRCPTTGRRVEAQTAQIDTAADRTVLPNALVAALELVQVGHRLFQGFGSQIIELPTYLVEVGIHDLPPVIIQAVLGEREPYVLLGRDVLNAFRLLLDGPQLGLEIG